MQTKNATGVRPLTDTELDTVSGGYLFFALGAGAAVVGAVGVAAAGALVGAKVLRKWWKRRHGNNGGGYGGHGGYHKRGW